MDQLHTKSPFLRFVSATPRAGWLPAWAGPGRKARRWCPVYNGKAVLFTLEDEYGPVNLYLLPFLKPAHIRRFSQFHHIPHRHQGDRAYRYVSFWTQLHNSDRLVMACLGKGIFQGGPARFFPEREISSYTGALSAAVEEMAVDTALRNVSEKEYFKGVPQ